MKTYTILEALKEINNSMPFDANGITHIQYEDSSKNKFIIEYAFSERYFVNLETSTYIKLINKSI